ncbi:MAG: hypothetical protein R3F20_09365 [Planctomycetota bacterium]
MRVAVLVLALTLGACASPSEPLTDHDRRGTVLLREGKVEEAREAFLQGAHAGDDRYTSWIGIAHCEARLGRSVAFENAALRATANAPRDPRAWDRLGRMYVQAAERFRATPRSHHYAGLGVEYLRRVFATEPETRDLPYNLGLGLSLAQDDATAAVMLEEAHRRDPRRVDVTNVYIGVLRRTGNAAKLREVLGARSDREAWPASWREAWDWAESREVGGVHQPRPNR